MIDRCLGLAGDGCRVLLTLGIALTVGASFALPVQMGLWSVGIAVVVMLRRGAGEGAATRLLGQCRAIRPAEAAALRPAIAGLVDGRVEPRAVYVSRRSTPMSNPVAAYGRRSVVVSPAFLERLSQGHADVAAAARSLARAEAWRASGSPKWDLTLRLLLMPGQCASRCASPLIRPLLSLPLFLAVWRFRWVVALVAVGDSRHQGHTAAGVVAAAVIAASYLSPAARRARGRRRTTATSALMIGPGPARSTWSHREDGVPAEVTPIPSPVAVKRERRHLTVVR